MRSRSNAEHAEAVSRRLALLTAELASVRSSGGEAAGPAGSTRPEEALVTGQAGAGDELWRRDWTGPHTRQRPVPSLHDGEDPPPARVIPLPGLVPTPGPGPGHEPSGPPERPRPAEPLAPPVREPGRHAARRRRAVLAAVVPDTLRGRVGLGPAQVAVVAVLVALGLAVTCWWLVRGRAQEVDVPVTPASAAPLVPAEPRASEPAGASAGPSEATAPGATEAAGEVVVDVAGKVRHPGIAVLGTGARVVDALEAAGGVRPGVSTSGLNLARVLVDGEQILVGVPAPVAPPATAGPGAGAGATAPAARVNLNTATETELEELPEVGPVTAASIVQWRTEHGSFTSVEELLEVDGIGDATLEKLTPYVTL